MVTKEKAWKSAWLPTPQRADIIGESHAFPVNDSYEHVLSADCRCKPVLEIVTYKGRQFAAFAHNAADGRELTERATQEAGKN